MSHDEGLERTYNDRLRERIEDQETIMTTPKQFDPTKPVRQKNGKKARILCTDFNNENYPIVVEVEGYVAPITQLVSGQYQWDATPSQLCEALLRATGKWVT